MIIIICRLYVDYRLIIGWLFTVIDGLSADCFQDYSV